MKALRRVFATRNSHFSHLNEHHLAHFQSILPSKCIQQQGLDPHNTDFTAVFKGESPLMLCPQTTEQVSYILEYCSAKKLAVVPQSGNTGLVGGSVPVHDEIIMNMGRMKNILGLDENQGIVQTEAGVVLETLNAFCETHGYVVPLDLGAKGSCLIGGNVATAAGGMRVLRYGSLHGSVIGLEAVTGKGEVINSMNSHRKDNTGYDLKQLFIGSEGTLGVITKVSLLLAPKPLSRQLALVTCNSFEDVVKCLKLSRTYLTEILSAFELMDKTAIEFVQKHEPSAGKYPFNTIAPFNVLIETSGSNEEHDTVKMERFLDAATGQCITNGILSNDLTQSNQLWAMRESVGYAANKVGYRTTFDVSLKLEFYYDLVEKLRAKVPKEAVVVGYGHVGDGNLHLSVVIEGESQGQLAKQTEKMAEDFVYEYLKNAKGSISAEHGIGVLKKSKLSVSRSEAELKYMKALKEVFDPAGILNPYKLLEHTC